MVPHQTFREAQVSANQLQAHNSYQEALSEYKQAYSATSQHGKFFISPKFYPFCSFYHPVSFSSPSHFLRALLQKFWAITYNQYNSSKDRQMVHLNFLYRSAALPALQKKSQCFNLIVLVSYSIDIDTKTYFGAKNKGRP